MNYLASRLAAACLAGLLLSAAPVAHGQALDLTGLLGLAGTPTQEASAADSRLHYVPTAALRRQAVQAVAHELQATSPVAASNLRSTFGPGEVDYDQLYTELLRNSGFVDNDAASALALYLEAGYRIVYTIIDDDEVTPAMERSLRQQAAVLLARTPGLGTAAAVARLGEQLKLRSVLLTLYWQEARKNGGLAELRRTVAQQFGEEYGLRFSQVQITAAGLVRR